MGMIKNQIGKQLGSRVTGLAPGLTTSFVREALARAINGVGPLPAAAKAAEKQLAEQKGDRDKAVRELVENHVRFAGAQGFVTNVGGLVTAPLTIPTNVTGLALLQCRMVAGIAHLRGYDLDDPKVRNAILVTVLGEDVVEDLVKKNKLPAPPMAMATAPVHDEALDATVSREVASSIISRITGKRAAVAVTRRIPGVGGVVGASADGYATWKIGRYAERELLPRAAR
ncbi:EcsC family protein [Nocardioides sp. AX2bis]|uniref:EcsC family protein n=1 Tax=Nocardioides sp. AX2bis TaxID=2653157 RepID=UPI0012F1DE86|nr:EcsC family protein [Nocardioides sp. AX2bis]VXC38996.1 EcsC protein family protein [Nocardioides sp. AX2bis]